FLTELTRLFQKCRTSGSVYITLKKYDGRTKPVPRKGNPETFDPVDNKCLLRATDGKKKISTVVSTKEVIKFQMVSNLCIFSCFSFFCCKTCIYILTPLIYYTKICLYYSSIL
ncbi:SRP14 protein, partial [Amia calva]|nr:SRP14 protein [Amia calva]